jgi:hypothetical protein
MSAKRVVLIAVVATVVAAGMVLAGAVSPSQASDPRQTKYGITDIHPDMGARTLTLFGNLCKDPHVFVGTHTGEMQEVAVLSATAREIVIDISSNLTDSGSKLVQVGCLDGLLTTQLALSLGAIGPVGPQGPQGLDGILSLQGKECQPGATVVGFDGNTGDPLCNDANDLCSANPYLRGRAVTTLLPQVVEYSDLTVSDGWLGEAGARVAFIEAGEQFTLGFDYVIEPYPDCPGCIHQIQYGFENADPAGCAYEGLVSYDPHDGSAEVQLEAPEQPGLYYITAGHTLEDYCHSTWKTAEKLPVAAICVVRASFFGNPYDFERSRLREATR